MALNVTFYTSSANPKKLDKSGNLTAIGTAKTLHVKHKIDILNPVFEVDYNSLFLAANYIYIAEFRRYYFCTISTDTAQRMTVSAAVDVLYSHMAQLKECPCNVIRAELGAPTYIKDSKYPIDSTRYFIQGIDFDNSDVLTGERPARPFIVVVR